MSVSAYTCLLLDLSGVVCTMDHRPRLARLARWSEVGEAEIYERVWESGLDAEFDEGRHGDTAGVLAVLRERIGFRGDEEKLREAWTAGFVANGELLDVLSDLGPGVRVAVLSDNGPVLLDRIDRVLGHWRPRFEQIIFSYEIGVLKPARKAFDHALERLAIPASRTVFLDDRPDNVEAADRLGIRAHLYTGVPETRRILRTYGLLTS